jgi:hypothetical protein
MVEMVKVMFPEHPESLLRTNRTPPTRPGSPLYEAILLMVQTELHAIPVTAFGQNDPALPVNLIWEKRQASGVITQKEQGHVNSLGLFIGQFQPVHTLIIAGKSILAVAETDPNGLEVPA